MAAPETCECMDKWQYLCAAAFQKRDGLSLVAKFRKRKKSEELVANEVSSNLLEFFSFENSTLTKAKKFSFEGGKLTKSRVPKYHCERCQII